MPPDGKRPRPEQRLGAAESRPGAGSHEERASVIAGARTIEQGLEESLALPTSVPTRRIAFMQRALPGIRPVNHRGGLDPMDMVVAPNCSVGRAPYL